MVARVDTAALVVGQHGHVAQPADHDNLVAQPLERLEDRRELERRASLTGRMEVGQEHPVGDVDEPEALGGAGRSGRRERAHHGVQEGQGNCGSDTPHERPAVQRDLRDDHRLIPHFMRHEGAPAVTDARAMPAARRAHRSAGTGMDSSSRCPARSTASDSRRGRRLSGSSARRACRSTRGPARARR